ncbi:type I restriction enzyme, S subunit [Proteiniborus ethanoligenes]|uniref:Type I restriction enzyme, S subunit n=1 Tax=Proteiniborus ethanoligenes TaxID=415015 RepID=A0A1H3RGZ0_9FIRM|nr:restriction endonuclease subunit S [Proteiniborus ethanoligenes]SDZ24478.1 type I restriction enzyme, S subunit [Proteiniborus ethanoligenes]
MYNYDILGKVATIQNGYAFKSSEFTKNGRFPVIKIKNIVGSKIDLTDCEYVDITSDDLNPYIVQHNDILISMTGSRASQPNSAVGKVGRMRLKNQKCYLNQRVGKLVVLDEDKTNKQFLFYVLNRKEINLMLANSASGSANQANISVSNITNLLIPQPAKIIQDKIVDILYPLDCKIESNEDRIITLQEVISKLYFNWFTNFKHPDVTDELTNGVPKGWKCSNVFDNIIEIKKKNLDNNNYPVLSVVKEGEFKASVDVFTKRVYSKSTKNYKVVRRNQVAYNPARANIGSIAILTEFDAGLVSPIYVVFEMKETITPTFFKYYMKQPEFLENIKHHAIGTTRQNLPFEAFKMFNMVVPPMDLQLRFEEIAKPIEQKIAKLKEENAVLAEIRDTLLPKLISGELPVEVGEA